VHLPENWDATFDIVTGDDMILPCKCSKDGWSALEKALDLGRVL
jgi:hypothetical protein